MVRNKYLLNIELFFNNGAPDHIREGEDPAIHTLKDGALKAARASEVGSTTVGQYYRAHLLLRIQFDIFACRVFDAVTQNSNRYRPV